MTEREKLFIGHWPSVIFEFHSLITMSGTYQCGFPGPPGPRVFVGGVDARNPSGSFDGRAFAAADEDGGGLRAFEEAGGQGVSITPAGIKSDSDLVRLGTRYRLVSRD